MFLWTDSTWQKCGVSDRDSVLVALSGGADSVALLLELLKLQRNGTIGGIAAAHLNHAIRGTQADADESFVRTLCDLHGIRLIAKRVDVPASAKRRGVSLELAARCERYAFLEKARIESNCDVIALGHHRDDQAETVLLRLIRGSGTDGLSGMRLRSGRLIRPLLNTGKDRIHAYLDALGQAYCTDTTNFETDAVRNKIRLQLMPILASLNPSISETLSETAKHLAEDADYLNGIADEAFLRFESDRMERSLLTSVERPIRIRILRRMLPYKDYTHADLDRLDALLKGQTGDTVSLKNGVVAWLDSSALRIGRNETESFCIRVPNCGSVRLRNGTLFAEPVSEAVVPCKGSDAYVDADQLCGTVIARSRVDGDRFTPFGMHGSRLLSDYLTDRKVPRFERDMPVLCDDNGIVFVAGHTIDERMRVGADTKHILHYHYEED